MEKARSNKALFWPNWLLAVIGLLLAGAVYREQASHLKLIAETAVALPVSLSAFPMKVGGWTGRDIPIAENIQRVAGNEDFLNRLYVNKPKNQWVNVYVAYSARPRTMLGHRPQVCYVAGGWLYDGVEALDVISNSGRTIPCLLHRFRKPDFQNAEVVVLNFYILNGQPIRSETGFSGIGWRRPNIAGDPARYVAQIQISSVFENSVRTATKDMAELILDFFPDEKGKVGVAEYNSIVRGVLK